MATKMIGARVPPDWAERIDEIATEKDCKPSHIIYEAIAAYLGKNQLATISTHESRITALEQKLSKIAGLAG